MGRKQQDRFRAHKRTLKIARLNMAKRLSKELSSIQTSPIPNVDVSLISDDNIFKWKVILTGPDSTPYSDGKFELLFDFPEAYPFKPPLIKFVTQIYHPNISQSTGEICSDVIQEDWGPTLNVRHCFNELLNLLKNPSADSPLEDEIASQLR